MKRSEKSLGFQRISHLRTNLTQIIALILMEKLALLFFPRMNQKLERFYKAVVEEALLGKDPDVADDYSHNQSGNQLTDKIARERQRQEICGAIRLQNNYYLFIFFMISETQVSSTTCSW